MSFSRAPTNPTCSICANNKEAQAKCKANCLLLEKLNILPSCHGHYMRFPASNGKTGRASRIKQRKIWLQHRSDKTGDENATYYAAAWHMPLKVLQDYAKLRQDTPKAHFPWSMSKEYGRDYECDHSLEVVYDGSKKATKDAFYFVAPIMTTEKFDQEELVMQQQNTPYARRKKRRRDSAALLEEEAKRFCGQGTLGEKDATYMRILFKRMIGDPTDMLPRP